jgi:Protein of unknown function (DUF3617)
MRRALLPAIVATLIANLAAALAMPALAQELPKRKSGLWEINMDRSSARSKDGKGPGKGVVTQCVDQAKDDAFHQMGLQMAREMKCTWTPLLRTPAGLSNESTCDLGTTKTRSKTVITGDFNTVYKMEIHTRYDPPMAGLTEGTTIMEGKWIGACKPGQRPGDMTMPGGMTMNIYDMMDANKK